MQIHQLSLLVVPHFEVYRVVVSGAGVLLDIPPASHHVAQFIIHLEHTLISIIIIIIND